MNGSKAMDKVKSSFRKLKGLSRRKKAVGAVALVAAVAVGSQLLKGFGSADAAAEYTEYTVQRGSITTSISGSGTVEPLNSYSQTTMAIIADMSQFKFTIYVDELDLSQLKEGQEVQITCDALPQLKLTGWVDNIGINGTSTNGVTNYPVKIVFDYVEGMLPVMIGPAAIPVTAAHPEAEVVPVDFKVPVIELKDIYKIYQMGDSEVRAADGINLTIYEEEMVAIIGQSGSGKSTCMNIIGCPDVPTSGTYYLKEQDVSHMTDDEQAEIRNKTLGFIFQQYNLIPKLNVLENVELPLVYKGVP